MKLLSAVSKPTRVATADNPVVGDTIDIILNDSNKLTFEGTNPKVALINTSFVPFIPGNGDFVINGSNNTFKYGATASSAVNCTMQSGTYTRTGFVQQLASAMNIAGDDPLADEWTAVGLDIRAQIANDVVQIASTKCNLMIPYFDDFAYWLTPEDYAPDPLVIVGTESINNASALPYTTFQNLTGGSVPRCRFRFEGKVSGVPGPGTTPFVLSIDRVGVGAYIILSVDNGQWKLAIGDQESIQGPFNSGDQFVLIIAGLTVYLIVNANVALKMTIPDPLYADIDTGLQLNLTLDPQYQIENVLMTTNPVPASPAYGTMTQIAGSYVNWLTEPLEVMVGSGSTTITGTVAVPSIITCSTPPVANSNIGNILVCLNMECGGHLSGPKTQAVRRFIYTIPNATSNLNPCTVIAPFLLPIDLDLRGYTSVTRMAIQFVAQVSDQAVGFTAPANITLAFLE